MTPEDFKREWEVKEFKNHVWERIGKNNDLYPNWMLAKFCEKWTFKPGDRKKMEWQLKSYNKSGHFFLLKRIANWKTLSINKFDPGKWKPKDKPRAPYKSPPPPTPEQKEQARLLREEAYPRLMEAAKNRPVMPGRTMAKQNLINKGIAKQEDYMKGDTEEYHDFEE